MLYPYIGSDNDVRVLTGTHIVSYQPHEDQDPDTPCIEVTQTTDTDITLNDFHNGWSTLTEDELNDYI